VVSSVLSGSVPAVARDETPDGSTKAALDTSSVTLPGDTLWSKRFSRPGLDIADDLGVSPDGSTVYVTGESQSPMSALDYVTVAYDAATGVTLWSRRYSRPGDDGAMALGVSPDGSKVFVTGLSEDPTSGYYDYATVAYDAATGTTLWATRYTRSRHDLPTSLGVSPDGSRVFVTGFSYGSTGVPDYATVAYDASTGARLWSRRYMGWGGYDRAVALGVSPDGSEVFVTGESEGSTDARDYATVAYDASTGAKLWVRRFTGQGHDDTASALGVSPDGSEVYVTGQSYGSAGPDYATVAYDASTGAQLWVKRYTFQGDDIARALGVSADGSKVFVTGHSFDSTRGDYDYATVAYDASTGAQLWVKRYNLGEDDEATALRVSPDGFQVFVTGYSYGSTSDADYATVAYDASTGAQLWVQRYIRPNPDFANSLGVSPDGSRVFVTGYSEGTTSDLDYATVAYSVT
jgi:WD40 repeat protein